MAAEQQYKNRVGNGIISIVLLMRPARQVAKETTADVYDTIPDGAPKEEYYQEAKKNGKLKRRLDDMSKALMAVYLLRDNWISRYVENEYNASYYQHNFELDTIVQGRVPLGNPSKRSRVAAFNNPNNVLADSEAMAIARRAQTQKVRQTIISSLNQGQSLAQTQMAVDITMGFRTRTGDLTSFAKQKILDGKLVVRGGQIYNSTRILRTEMSRMHAKAMIDGMGKAQNMGVEERLKKITVFDSRTRAQSEQMAGQQTDREGRLTYPDGNKYFMGDQPIQWAANDRGSLIPVVIGGDVTKYQRNPPSNRFSQWLNDNDININPDGKRYEP